MSPCNWCGCEVDQRKADIDGNHLNFTDCIGALKMKVGILMAQIVHEMVHVAELTEQLEQCQSCPSADLEENPTGDNHGIPTN